MADTLTHTRSFAGGEVTREFFGRIDDIKYQTGLATCRNFIVLPHGPVANRPGTQFVREVKNSAKFTRLLPFTFADDQTLILEFGEGYFRFHTMGGTVLNGAVPYEVAHPYLEAQLNEVQIAQSADVITLTHHSHPVRELKRLGATNWTLTDVVFAPKVTSPTGLVGTAHAGATPGAPLTQEYAITAIAADGVDESRASASTTVSNNLYDDGAYNDLTWSATAGAVRYNVFKRTAGLLGYIGQTDQLTFRDDNIAPDLGKTPPLGTNPFNGVGNYPAAVSYFDQRRVFGATDTQPQRTWMSKEGTESNMDAAIPTLDTDAISFRIAARDANRIRHIVPMNDMILLTSAAAWRITSINTDALTPTSISARVQASSGANKTTPITINNSMLYIAARGGHMRELGFSRDAGGYTTGDISLRAPHLFDNLDITSMAFCSAPYPIVWSVSTSGKLIGLTYVPEQQVGAFHQHDTTNGVFESCAAVAEGKEDVLYVVVRRVINGATVRYVERMASRAFVDQRDAFFVDCGATYNGAATSTVTGLAWLEGQTVSILADGSVRPQQVVTGGAIMLDDPASVVQVGLPITADIETLPLALETAGYGHARPKNIAAVYVQVYRSSGIFAGPGLDELTEAKQRTFEAYGAPPSLKSEDVEIVIDSAWTDAGRIFIRQVDPLPLTILSLTLDVAFGGG